MNARSRIYVHAPHPHIEHRRKHGPVTAASVAAARTGGLWPRVNRFNARLAKLITSAVGTIWCFYVFNGIALTSLPTAIHSRSLQIIINWVSSNWMQLILLPAVMVGTNLISVVADKRAEQTYADAEAVLHEALQIQKHLEAQDEVLAHLLRTERH